MFKFFLILPTRLQLHEAIHLRLRPRLHHTKIYHFLIYSLLHNFTVKFLSKSYQLSLCLCSALKAKSNFIYSVITHDHYLGLRSLRCPSGIVDILIICFQLISMHLVFKKSLSGYKLLVAFFSNSNLLQI